MEDAWDSLFAWGDEMCEKYGITREDIARALEAVRADRRRMFAAVRDTSIRIAEEAQAAERQDAEEEARPNNLFDDAPDDGT